MDDWAGKAHNFCKPVAKYPHDREALWNVIEQGDTARVMRFPRERPANRSRIAPPPHLAAHLCPARLLPWS